MTPSDPRLLACAAMAGIVFVACASDRAPPDPLSHDHDHGRTGKVSQDLSAAALFGTSLGTKQLALSFDDGPGSRTLELSTYLKNRGIAATFFVNSQCFDVGNGCGNTLPAATVLAQLVADGHIVANHTRDHKDLTSLAEFPNTPAGNAAMIKELSDVDAVIAPYVPGTKFMFRAPYGGYDNRVYNVLHASAMDKYVGHIEWDIGGARTATTAADWACWQNNPKLTSKACGDLYIQETNAVGKGIVLMHDADYGNVGNTDPLNGTGNTIDMVKYMVPLLEAAGYTFKRVDQVPAVAALFPAPPCDPTCATCTGPGANQCTSCDAGRYLSGGQCLVCATCAANQYQASACTANANTVCGACNAACATCSGPSANECTSCGAGKYLNGTACATCSVCAAGTYEAAACTEASDTVCSPCDASCAACSGPAPADCGSCPPKYYLGGGICNACAVCAAGSYASTACTATANTKCTACPPGTSAAAGASTCAPCASGTFSAGGAAACTACGDCDDANACTEDRCDPVRGCVHASVPGCSTPAPQADAGTVDAGSPDVDAEVDAGTTPTGDGAEDGCSVTGASKRRVDAATLLFGALGAAIVLRRRRRP